LKSAGIDRVARVEDERDDARIDEGGCAGQAREAEVDMAALRRAGSLTIFTAWDRRGR
jgi:hypothetical protein